MELNIKQCQDFNNDNFFRQNNFYNNFNIENVKRCIFGQTLIINLEYSLIKANKKKHFYNIKLSYDLVFLEINEEENRQLQCPFCYGKINLKCNSTIKKHCQATKCLHRAMTYIFAHL